MAKPKTELARRDRFIKGSFRQLQAYTSDLHLYRHLTDRGAKPSGEVAKPKTELPHRDRFRKVTSVLYI